MNTVLGQPGTAGILVILAGALMVSLAGWLYAQYLAESRLLRQVAMQAAGPDLGHPERLLERLNHWVYNNQGFAKNPRFFLSPRLGPTPLQVLDSGGDCADKSMLLAAMLDELGVPSTLVMLYSRDYAQPTHTVVETRLPNFRAAADPVFDLVFPDGQGGLLGVSQLQARHDLFLGRLAALVQARGPTSKVSYYKSDSESYRWPRTINWGRMAATRLVGQALGLVVSNPDLISRPRLLAEPKLLVSLMLLGAGVLVLGGGWLLLR
ncbi:MAG TPA: hypothetical protein VES73_15545 [Lamprocystis sp. (in: g-proteobacteria)]|nr:hypothetical protein [Lamprocystis sp. (in: g-proteobacteria)]